MPEAQNVSSCPDMEHTEKEKFRQFLWSLCVRMNLSPESEAAGVHELVERFRASRTELHTLFVQMIQVLEFNEFIVRDHELRMKMRDVYDFQVRQGQERQKQIEDQIRLLIEE